MQRLDNHKRPTGRVTTQRDACGDSLGPGSGAQRAEGASTGREMCEKTLGAAHRRHGDWWVRAPPACMVRTPATHAALSLAEAGRVAQLHLCFC